MNPEFLQPALRNFIETFHKTVDLYLLAITKNKILPAFA